MCAPELDFCDYSLPHFQTCPLLSCILGRGWGGVCQFRVDYFAVVAFKVGVAVVFRLSWASASSR